VPRRAVSIESEPIGSSGIQARIRHAAGWLAGWRKNRSKADVAGAPANAMQPAGETTINA